MTAKDLGNKTGTLYISYEICLHVFTLEIRNFMFYSCENRVLCFIHVLWNFACFNYMHLAIDLANKIFNFYFYTYVIWGTDMPLLNMDYSILHIWKSRQRFNPSNIKFSIYHSGKGRSCFSYMKYSLLHISKVKISAYILLHEIWISSIVELLNTTHSRIGHILDHQSSFSKFKK